MGEEEVVAYLRMSEVCERRLSEVRVTLDLKHRGLNPSNLLDLWNGIYYQCQIIITSNQTIRSKHTKEREEGGGGGEGEGKGEGGEEEGKRGGGEGEGGEGEGMVRDRRDLLEVEIGQSNEFDFPFIDKGLHRFPNILQWNLGGDIHSILHRTRRGNGVEEVEMEEVNRRKGGRGMTIGFGNT